MHGRVESHIRNRLRAGQSLSMMNRKIFLCSCVAVATLSLPIVALAQETRAETIAREQAEKAKRLTTYTPTGAERALEFTKRLLTSFEQGWYPALGSVYSGGGLAVGAGYRHLVGDRASTNIVGLYSIKQYKLVELSFNAPRSTTGHWDYGLRAGWRDATQVAYHGLGIDSPQARNVFRMQQLFAGGDVSVRPQRWLAFKGGASHEDYELKDGLGASPSVFTTFTPATAPGLGANPTYLHTSASAGIDWRPATDYARTGGLYEVTYHRYADRDDTYTFDRMDAEIVQHIPVLRENWVLSLHGLMQSTLDADSVVPYFLLPSLGSGDTLRAYSSWRFRDRHSLLMSAEWRWVPSRLALDMALFYDAGIVANRRSDLGFRGMKSNVGIGARFHTPIATPLRIELARGREGMRLVFTGGAAF
jgi:hypothetical protein